MREIYVIFGCGVHGRNAYEHLHNVINITAFSDNDISYYGTDIEEGVKCINPCEIPKEVKVIIATGKHHWGNIQQQLRKLHLEYITLDELVFELYKNNVETILKDYLYDDESKSIYKAILEYRASNVECMDSKFISNADEYFELPQFKFNFKKEIMVDAGAFVGDTVEKYLSYRLDYIRKIYAFEPCERQFNALQIRKNRLVQEYALDADSIVCERAALSDQNAYCLMESSTMTGSGNFVSSISEKPSEESVPIYRLDDYLEEELDFLKADIEGNELKMLKGATTLIKKCKPRLAICIYHTPFDLIEIPEYIKSIVPEYKMAVRHYTTSWTDSILYCWI